MRIFLIPLACLAALGAPTLAQRASRAPEPYALTGIRVSSDKDAPRFTLLLKGGRIEALLPAAQEISGEYRVLSAEGLLAVPAMVDVFSHSGIEMPDPNTTQDIPVSTKSDVRIEMRMANRKGIQPDWMAAKAYSMSDSDVEERREGGFGAQLSAPHGEILSGVSAAVLLGKGAPRDVILSARVFGHAAFEASGSGYPGTLMGMHAQFRQFLMDSSWQAELRQRRESGMPGPRPAFDPSLQAGERLLSGELRLVCEAQSARDIYRWMALADEFQLKIAIAGGRDAWQVAAELAEKDIPVVLTLQWSKEAKDPDAKDKDKEEDVDKDKDKDKDEKTEGDDADTPGKADEADGDWTYEEPLALQRERRRRWELQRDNALRLQEAGVEVYFGSGSDSVDDLMSQARVLVEAGYPRDVMMAAMTAGGARWLNIDGDLGSLKVGSGANVCLWTADPFDEKSKVRFSFVDGFLESWDIKEDKSEAPDSDMSGSWDVTFDQAGMAGGFELEMTDAGALSGVARVMAEDGLSVIELKGQLSGKEFTLKGILDMDDMEIPIEITGTLDGDGFEASADSQEASVPLHFKLKGVRKPEGGKS